MSKKPCGICGKKINPKGMSGHMKIHEKPVQTIPSYPVEAEARLDSASDEYFDYNRRADNDTKREMARSITNLLNSFAAVIHSWGKHS